MKYTSNFLYIILAVILFNIISTSNVKKWVMWFEKNQTKYLYSRTSLIQTNGTW